MIIQLSIYTILISIIFGFQGTAYALDLKKGLLHPEQDESSIRAFWVSLKTRDDIIELERPRLTLKLANPSGEYVQVQSRLRVVTNGNAHALHIPKVRLAPGKERLIKVRLPRRLVESKYDRLRFSGKITLSLEVISRSRLQPHKFHLRHNKLYNFRPEKVHFSLPTLYFHSNREKLLVYREDVMRERFHAGNFRNTPLAIPSFNVEKDLKRMGLQRITPVLAFIHEVKSFPGPSFPGDILPPGSKKFCFGLDGAAFDDSGEDSVVVFSDPNEDFGIEGDFVPATRAWVAVGQQGNPLYTGFLDPDGCTPFIIANSTNEISVAFFPLYLHQSVGIRGFVSDLNLGPQWPDSMPYFLFFFAPGNNLITQVLLDEEEYVNTIYVAAANSMERARGGLSNVLYEFRLREEGDNSGTNAFYAAEGHPQVRIKYSVAAREKFVIAHEYAHAMHIAKLSPPLTVNDLDYSVTADEAEQHTLDSKEWQLTAAFEGFAHFVSALIWNDAVPNEDALFRSGGETIDLDVYDRLFETNFNSNLFPDQGNEIDWAQFFWNYHTDVFTTNTGDPVLAPPLAAIMDMWLVSQPWPVTHGFFDDFREGVEVIVGTFGPANPVEEGLERFNEIAEDAGVDH